MNIGYSILSDIVNRKRWAKAIQPSKSTTKHIIQSLDMKIETQKYLEAYTRERDLNERKLEHYQTVDFPMTPICGNINS